METPCPRVRDIGIFAHIDAGKTSLNERLLYVSGGLREAGSVDRGTTATDYLAVERERGITVKAAAAHLRWPREDGDYRVNLIDTPGHADFGAEVERALRALDGTVLLVCAVAGLQSRTGQLYRAFRRRGAPGMIFVNKMDRRGASFSRVLADLGSGLDSRAAAIQLPWGEGPEFRGIVDLVRMRAWDCAADEPGPLPMPRELEAPALAAREALVAAIAEGIVDGLGAEVGGAPPGGASPREDAVFAEDYLAGRMPEARILGAALRRATLAGRIVPTLCGCAFSDMAASLLLDAVVDYLPAPGEAGAPEGFNPRTGAVERRAAEAGAPFSALIFKAFVDKEAGPLGWARIWSGSLALGSRAALSPESAGSAAVASAAVAAAADRPRSRPLASLLEARSGLKIKVQRIFRIQADRLEALDSASSGDIVALSLAPLPPGGLIGSSLCDPAFPISYEDIRLESPVVSCALEPRSKADGELLRAGLEALTREDPSLRACEDPLTGRSELSGMGELHLEVALERLSRDFGVRVRAGEPRVAFREALAGPASAREDFDRDLGGERVRALVALSLFPPKADSGAAAPGPKPLRKGPCGLELRPSVGLKTQSALLEAAARGIEAALSIGPGAGFPLEGALVLVDEIRAPGGAGKPGTSALKAVEIAASLAAGRALRQAGSLVLEPVMRVELELPDEVLGAVAAALTGRGGRIEAVDEDGEGGKRMTGQAPLRRLFGFAGELGSVSGGRARYSARFQAYEPVPRGFSDWTWA